VWEHQFHIYKIMSKDPDTQTGPSSLSLCDDFHLTIHPPPHQPHGEAYYHADDSGDENRPVDPHDGINSQVIYKRVGNRLRELVESKNHVFLDKI